MLTTSGLPDNEAEVIKRLKNKPHSIKAVATMEDDGDNRHWVSLRYEYDGKLKKLGEFLYEIAKDVEQAGGLVTQFSFDSLRPNNGSPDDYNPHGKWREMFVTVGFRTQKRLNAEKQAWDEAAKDIVNQFRKR